MYGSFIGDIVGAPYEFDKGPRDKNFRFFAHPKSRFTDDSLLTVAISEALMDLKKADMDNLPKGKTKKQLCMEAINNSSSSGALIRTTPSWKTSIDIISACG